MADYIKREDAKELFYMLLEHYHDTGVEVIKHTAAIAPKEFHISEEDDIADFNFEIDAWKKDFSNIPSADVAPVRHGRWIVGDSLPMHDIAGNLSWGNWYTCNQCEFKTYAIERHITQYNYCPNCGARMDCNK